MKVTAFKPPRARRSEVSHRASRSPRRLWSKAAVLVLLLAFALPTAALAQSDTPLVIAADQKVTGSVSTVAQDIHVDGVVQGDVTSWSGGITIAGTVGGDVVSYGGPVHVTATGRVGGHVLASGGALRLDTGAVVAGQAISGDWRGALASLLDLFIPTTTNPGAGPLGRALLVVVLAVLALAFCLVGTALWPRRVAIASTSLLRLPGRALALGLLTTLVLGLATAPLAGLLIASVIGLPLLLVLLIAVLAPYIYGIAVLARALSAWVAAPNAQRQPPTGAATATAVVLVVLVAAIALVAPLWGLALFYLLGSPGLGGAILSRGGMVVPLAAQ